MTIDLTARFYETYYFCNIIQNVLEDQFSYIRHLHDFHTENEAAFFHGPPFPKLSSFHSFIIFVIESLYDEEVFKMSIEEIFPDANSYHMEWTSLLSKEVILPIERAMKYYNVRHQTFKEFALEKAKNEDRKPEEEDIYDYMNELIIGGERDELYEHMAKEVFHVLFQNRGLMLTYNLMMANALEDQSDSTPPEEVVKLFKKDGRLKRVEIPKWVKKAVYFRDRGRCTLCDMDLSGLVNIENSENYDHIVPLASYGLNDVTNIQLLCSKCNKKKSGGTAITSYKYQTWYSYDE